MLLVRTLFVNGFNASMAVNFDRIEFKALIVLSESIVMLFDDKIFGNSLVQPLFVTSSLAT